MCGIAALVRSDFKALDSELIGRMTSLVAHRGPDGSGILLLEPSSGSLKPMRVSSPKWRVALGHRRLSIIDLSQAGAQPMSYRDYLYITYNGEVYNYVELRAELQQLGHEFKSHSDTEVILAAYDAWGPRSFERLRGMWAFVLVDARKNALIVCRDRIGIKPLYVLEQDGLVAIGSEPKQFLHIGQARLSVDLAALRSYLLTGYEQPSRSFFSGLRPLAPGTFQVLSLDSLRLGPEQPYWHPERVRQAAVTSEEAGNLFRDAFADSVRVHLRSDVPVGCALSGGLDSSAVAACAQQELGADAAPIRTFSITFPGHASDERAYMDIVSRSVGTLGDYVTPTAAEFVSELDNFLRAHDEPVGSLSQYAGYRVARLTRQAGVPVTLNGQGGDEIFSAYWQCYFVYLNSLASSLRWTTLARELLGAALPNGNSEVWRQMPAMARRLASRLRPTRTLKLLGDTAEASGPDGPLGTVLSLGDADRRIFDVRCLTLPRLLKWDDRNFMAFSVEGRYPFLDHPLIELCLSFPRDALYRHGWTKEPLRRGLSKLLPLQIARRKTKLGFETPQEDWLCGPLFSSLKQFVFSDSPLWKHVHQKSAQDLAIGVWRQGGHAREDAQALFRTFLVDRWLRLYGLT